MSAAIHARIKGHDVLVLEASDGSGGKARGLREGSYRLDPGPSIVILPRIYERLFAAAGRRMSDYLRFRRLDPISRVYFEGIGPLDLPADREAYSVLIRSISPLDAASFSSLMSTLDAVSPHIDKSIFRRPYESPWQLADRHMVATALRFDARATYKELVDRWFTSPLLRAFFYGFPSYGGQSYDSKAPGALMIPYLMIQEGVFYPEGGVAAIPLALERLARELGVEFQFGKRIRSLDAKAGRILAATTEQGERFEASSFISNVDRLTTRAMFGHSVDWQPSLSYFTLHWGLRVVMSGLQHHTLLIPPTFEQGFEQLYRRDRFPDEPIVYLNATSVENPDTAPVGCTNLFAVATSPGVRAELDWEGQLKEYRERVLQIMNRFGFGIDNAQIEFERVQTPKYFEAEHGNYRGSLYGPAEQHRLFGLFPLTNRDDDVKNLFYCGGSVQPGAGLPMVILSGEFAAAKL